MCTTVGPVVSTNPPHHGNNRESREYQEGQREYFAKRLAELQAEDADRTEAEARTPEERAEAEGMKADVLRRQALAAARFAEEEEEERLAGPGLTAFGALGDKAVMGTTLSPFSPFYLSLPFLHLPLFTISPLLN